MIKELFGDITWRLPSQSNDVSTTNEEILTLSEWTQRLMQIYDGSTRSYRPFSFAGREYLLPIYDGDFNKIVFLAGRQSEKCFDPDFAFMLTPDGLAIRFSRLKPGDFILGLIDGEAGPVEIKKIFKCGIVDFYLIEFEDGNLPLLVSSNHHVKSGSLVVPISSFMDNYKKNGIYGIIDGIYGGRDVKRVIKSISFFTQGEAWDIEVTGDNLYVLNYCIVHNSTTLANIGLLHCALNSHFRTLYVAPTDNQVTRFSRDRLEDVIGMSPRLKKYYNPRLADNIKERGFMSGSRFILRSAYTRPDRIRGIPADLLVIDELASMISDHIPIIEECLSHSSYHKRIFAGTPVIPEDAMGHYWQDSSQNEWVVPCDRHTPVHWNVIMPENLGKEGLICDKCGGPINPRDSRCHWVRMAKDKVWTGFRISQVIVPGIDWNEINYKRNTYPQHQFYNEVMALFADTGARPINAKELREICNPDISLDAEKQSYYATIGTTWPIYAGIDWGGNTQSSYTVLALGSYFGGPKLKIFYLHRFEGSEAEPVIQVDRIEEILRRYHARIIAADYGFGFMQNAMLEQRLITDGIIYSQCFYAFNPQKIVSYNKRGRKWILHRSQVMSNLFGMMKMGKIELPRWEDFEPYSKDILEIVSNYDSRVGVVRYEHPKDKPDDTFHAILYCTIASFLDVPKTDIFGVPTVEYTEESF